MSPQADLFDLYRAGLKNAADFMKASLESAERLQSQQLVAIRNALEQQSQSMGELGEAKTLDQLLALQTRIAGAQLERAVNLWGDLVQVATQEAAKLAVNAQAAVRSASGEQGKTAAP
jgi:hypothetical protein